MSSSDAAPILEYAPPNLCVLLVVSASSRRSASCPDRAFRPWPCSFLVRLAARNLQPDNLRTLAIITPDCFLDPPGCSPSPLEPLAPPFISHVMSANHNYVYTSLANIASGPHARWRRILSIASIPMICAFIYFALEPGALPSYSGVQYVVFAASADSAC